MVFSLKSLLFQARRNKQVEQFTVRRRDADQANVREFKRMQDELKLAREKLRLDVVLLRNRIF